MTVSGFNFHLLRVTMAQLLKAHGFDKSDNRALDVVTDICVKYMRLLTLTIFKYTELRNAQEPSIQDVTDAFRELKLISPLNMLDAFDIGRLTGEGINSFESWFMGDMNSKMREAARPNTEFVNEVIKTRKMKDVGSKMSSLTAAYDQQNQQAQQLNPTLPYSPMGVPLSSKAAQKRRREDDNTVDDDWIKFVLRQQINENPDLKFKGTVLIDYLPEDKRPPKRTRPCKDYVVVGPTPEQLEPFLPYAKTGNDRELELEDKEEISAAVEAERLEELPESELPESELPDGADAGAVDGDGIPAFPDDGLLADIDQPTSNLSLNLYQ